MRQQTRSVTEPTLKSVTPMQTILKDGRNGSVVGVMRLANMLQTFFAELTDKNGR